MVQMNGFIPVLWVQHVKKHLNHNRSPRFYLEYCLAQLQIPHVPTYSFLKIVFLVGMGDHGGFFCLAHSQIYRKIPGYIVYNYQD